ncbi:aspartic peptidase domain-containing protein [Apodospora peruviana]|uniref:Probable aspartic-type endopeptidase OPSB n=1 Tax=Apodospora peruviana TaxID=516989 RepID=A0AAE0HX13_9PEZI|nr:aspartic peptidase domain-containing protein [Apodospora peruviana]
MRASFALAAAASFLSATTEGLVLQQKHHGPGPKVVAMDIERRQTTNPLHRDRLRKRATVEAALDNEETLYFINATIGTPPRSVRLHIDTGSSDLWVNTPSSKLCLQTSSPCGFAGTYTANSSSTYEYIGSYFNISYVDGSGASGDYVSDTVTIGQTKLDRLQFGVGYSSTNSQGILGIGYPINEVQVGRAGLQPYDNLPAQMVTDGLISSKAYSLWLNDLDASRGNILFGGVDTEKYEGTLQTLPIQTSSGVFAEFMITMTNVKLGDKTISQNDLALAVLLDTGSSLTYLPNDMVETIYQQVGAQYDSDQGAAYVPCSLAQETTTISFTFSQPTIAVEMNELVLDLITSSGKRPTFQNGVTACLFGIAPAGSGTNVLGDTFLRSAYVVYDMDNNEISIAQTKFNTTASNVVEITTGPDAVPDATAVANPVAATQGLSGPPGGSAIVGLGGPDSAAAPATSVRGGGVVALFTSGLVTAAILSGFLL